MNTSVEKEVLETLQNEEIIVVVEIRKQEILEIVILVLIHLALVVAKKYS